LVTDTLYPAQQGQPVPKARLLIGASHSWSGPSVHIHQAFLLDLATTLSGVKSPFFVTCHSAAISGYRAANELVTDTLLPEQQGQPFPPTREFSVACHSWSGPFGHIHHAFLAEPATIWSGARLPFFAGCHWAANSVSRKANELVAETFRPRQYGQPFPQIRLTIEASHSWSGPFGHIHHAFLAEPARAWSGVRLPFFVGCHWAANSVSRKANELVAESFWPAQNGQPLPPDVRLLIEAGHSWPDA